MANQDVAIADGGVFTPLLVFIIMVWLFCVESPQLGQTADNTAAMLKIMQAQQQQATHDRMLQECHK